MYVNYLGLTFMEYSYHCKRGCSDFYIAKRAANIDDPETCPKCDAPGERFFNPGKIQLMGVGDGWFDDTPNPAFGKVIGSRANLRKELAEMKAQGREVVEVGNEPVENIHKLAEDTQRAKSAARWAKASEEVGITNV
jgi:hypothetical protein